MNHKFTIGAIAGASALLLAVPIFSQMSFAASTTPATTGTTQSNSMQQAAISQSAAEQTALQAHPGTLSQQTRPNKHFGGYKVEVKGSDGNEYDVIVDSATGKVTDSWVDGQGGPMGGHGHGGPADANGQQPPTQTQGA